MAKSSSSKSLSSFLSSSKVAYPTKPQKTSEAQSIWKPSTAKAPTPRPIPKPPTRTSGGGGGATYSIPPSYTTKELTSPQALSIIEEYKEPISRAPEKRETYIMISPEGKRTTVTTTPSTALSYAKAGGRFETLKGEYVTLQETKMPKGITPLSYSERPITSFMTLPQNPLTKAIEQKRESPRITAMPVMGAYTPMPEMKGTKLNITSRVIFGIAGGTAGIGLGLSGKPSDIIGTTGGKELRLKGAEYLSKGEQRLEDLAFGVSKIKTNKFIEPFKEKISLGLGKGAGALSLAKFPFEHPYLTAGFIAMPSAIGLGAKGITTIVTGSEVYGGLAGLGAKAGTNIFAGGLTIGSEVYSQRKNLFGSDKYMRAYAKGRLSVYGGLAGLGAISEIGYFKKEFRTLIPRKSIKLKKQTSLIPIANIYEEVSAKSVGRPLIIYSNVKNEALIISKSKVNLIKYILDVNKRFGGISKKDVLSSANVIEFIKVKISPLTKKVTLGRGAGMFDLKAGGKDYFGFFEGKRISAQKKYMNINKFIKKERPKGYYFSESMGRTNLFFTEKIKLKQEPKGNIFEKRWAEVITRDITKLFKKNKLIKTEERFWDMSGIKPSKSTALIPYEPPNIRQGYTPSKSILYSLFKKTEKYQTTRASGILKYQRPEPFRHGILNIYSKMVFKLKPIFKLPKITKFLRIEQIPKSQQIIKEKTIWDIGTTLRNIYGKKQKEMFTGMSTKEITKEINKQIQSQKIKPLQGGITVGGLMKEFSEKGIKETKLFKTTERFITPELKIKVPPFYGGGLPSIFGGGKYNIGESKSISKQFQPQAFTPIMTYKPSEIFKPSVRTKTLILPIQRTETLQKQIQRTETLQKQMQITSPFDFTTPITEIFEIPKVPPFYGGGLPSIFGGGKYKYDLFKAPKQKKGYISSIFAKEFKLYTKKIPLEDIGLGIRPMFRRR